MIELVPFRPQDLPLIETFVAAIQEHERAIVPELLSGAEIASSYAAHVVAQVEARDGVLLLAWDGGEAVGFGAAWQDSDDDPLLSPAHRAHARVSDLFVRPEWRELGIGQNLLAEIERQMRARLPAPSHHRQGKQYARLAVL